MVWVLVPTVATDDPNLACYSDYSHSHGEFERAFAALGMEWRWQPVSLADHRAIIEDIARQRARQPAIVFNLCDGDETNGVPGLSVIRCLEEHGLPYTGADEPFYRDTTSKIDMKQLLDRAGVPTSPWEVVEGDSLAPRRVFKRLGRPLIVKPAVSAGSLGITVKSVVGTAAALRAQLRRLEEGYRGWDLASAGVFVERFVDGPEFTSFIVGAADDPDGCIVYPAVERVFHASLPSEERFLSFDRLWEVYEEEAPIGQGEYLWEYRPAPAELQSLIDDVSWRAYAAVGGRGYGRVDLRMDAGTRELFVLEVNAQCGLSEDEDQTSIGAILRYAGRPFHVMVREILDGAVAPRPVQAARASA